MYWSVIIGVSVAMFAVFGFCSAVRTVMGMLFPNRRISVAIEVMDARDAADLEFLLEEAASCVVNRGVRPVVLVSNALMDGIVGCDGTLHDGFDELLDRFGAECYLIDP